MANVHFLKRVRLAFPDLQKAVQYQGQGPFKFRASLLVPVNDPQKAYIDKVIRDVAAAQWPKGWEKILAEVLPDKKQSCWIDGNRREYDGYKDMWALSATRDQDKGRPSVVDLDVSPIFDERGEFNPGKAGRIYAGCYVNAKIEIWAQDNGKGKGIRSTLNALQFCAPGDAFGGGAPASSEGFEAIEAPAEVDGLAD